MKRTLAILGIFVTTLMVTPVARAQDHATGDILSAVPGDAWAVLCIRNAAEFDQKLMSLAQRLNVPPISALQMAKASMGLMSGVNDNGSIAVVYMPVENFGNPMQGMVVLAPCSDYAALTGAMQLEPAGEGFDGISKVMIAGSPSYMANQGGYALIGPTPDGIKQFMAAKGKPGMGKTWTKHQLERFAKDDITLWINLEGFFTSPLFQSGIMPMLAMSSGGAFNPAELADYRSAVVSVRLDKDGAYLGISGVVKEGSPSGKLLASAPVTTESLLQGLPGGPYLLAFGARGSQQAWDKMAQGFDQTLSNPMLAMMLQQPSPDNLNHVKEILTKLIGSVRGVSFGASALPAGPDGLLNLSKIVTVDGDAAAKCTLVSDLIGTVSAMVPEAQGQKVKDIVRYIPDAEKIAGVSVHHITVRLDKLEGMTPEDSAKIQKIFGKEGILVRLAAIDDTHMASSFGGGPARMQKLIELTKSGSAPLAEDAGVKKVAGTLPGKRYVEGYLSVDQLVATIHEIAKAVDEPSDLPNIPRIGVPLAMVVSTGAEGVLQLDVAVPMEVIVAAKDVAMSMQGGGPGQQPAPQPAGAGSSGTQ